MPSQACSHQQSLISHRSVLRFGTAGQDEPDVTNTGPVIHVTRLTVLTNAFPDTATASSQQHSFLKCIFELVFQMSGSRLVPFGSATVRPELGPPAHPVTFLRLGICLYANSGLNSFEQNSIILNPISKKVGRGYLTCSFSSSDPSKLI